VSASSSARDDFVWSFAWWAIALVAAILVFVLLSFLIPDDPAAGLIFGGVAFVLVGGLMVRFGPGPGPNQEIWHDPDALPSMTHSAPTAATGTPLAPEPVAAPPAPGPVAPVAPVAAPFAGAAEVEAPAPGTGISERVRDAARAAGEAARAMAGDAAAPLPEPVRPDALDAPADGGADNLKRIKGVGPKLEELLHSLGIYHFSQIAAWGPAEVAWMDSNLEGFFGRVTRDDWVAQAKLLAAGDETGFSKRVDDGEVY
jgi:predicted flap endonuclease-1-like 5' DNA nuclease